MKIGPFMNDRLPASMAGRQRQTLPASKEFRGGDSVDISSDSRKQLAQSADERLKLEQTPSPVYSRKDFAKKLADTKKTPEPSDREAMLSEIKDRVASGYYNRQDITFLVADKLSDEFNS